MKTTYTKVKEVRTNANDLVGYELLEDATEESVYVMFPNGELGRFALMGSIGDVVKIVKKDNIIQLVNNAVEER